MSVRKVLRLLTLGAACLGAVAATAVTGILAMNSDQDAELFAANTRHYKGEWYNEGALVYEGYFTRGQDVSYEGPTPSKVDYTGEKIYIFSGWDTTGDNIPDIPVFKAYRNFKANATYTSIDASILEKIDWQKLLEILMDSNIDLEALLARLGLSPEDIARLLGLNVFTVTSNVTGPAYFRTESFKDYNKSGHNWTDADYYSASNISPGSVNPLQFTANKLSSLKNDPLIASYCSEGTYEIQYNKSGGKYPVIAFESENTQGLSSDSYSLVQPDSENKYVSHGFPLIPCTEETVLAGLITPFSNDAIKNDERTYRDYVRNEYLGISDEYRNYFSNLANQIGASKNNVGQAVTVFTEYLTNNFTLEYKRNEFPKSSDPLLYFMNEAKVADSNYFASAMTLFLRSLGYPARYTQGYMGAIAEAGVPTDVTALQAYSWCEVYVDGIGWMNADGAEYLLVKLFNEYYDLPEEVLDMMDFSNKGTSRTLESIRIGDNTKFNYVGGSNFSEDDIELIATYSDGYEEKVKPCYVAKPDISDYKNYYDRNVTVLYEYLTDIKSANYTIHVEPAKIQQLNVTNYKSYTTVTPVSIEDFAFTGLYSNGSTYDVNRYAVEYSFPETDEPGDYPLEFTFTEYYGGPDDYATVTATFILHVEEEPYIVEIIPMYSLNRLFYTDEGFYFDRDSWYAYRNNGEITEISITDDMILNPEILEVREPGNFTLEIQASETCEIYQYSFEMIENVLEYIEGYANQSVFYKSLENPYVLTDDDLTIYAHYTRDYDYKQIYLSDVGISQDTFNEAGRYFIEITYVQDFEFAGEIEVVTQIEINIDTNEVVALEAQGYGEPVVYVGEELTRDLFNSYYFIAYRKDGSYFTVDYNDPNITFDFDVVDRFEPGYYEVPVYYHTSDLVEDVETEVYLHIIGIQSFEGYFGGLPEALLTNVEYSLDDYNRWGLYAEVTYYDGAGFVSTEDVYPGDPKLEILLDAPFNEAGSYDLTLHYSTGYEDAYDSTIVTVIEHGVKDVEFDLSSIEESYKYNEEIDFSQVNVDVSYYDETDINISYESGLIQLDTISHGGEPEQIELVFTVTIDGVDYSESVFTELIRPTDVYFGDEVYENEHYTVDPLNLDFFPVYIENDDGSVELVTDPSLVSLSYTEPVHSGTNYVEIVYDDGITSFTTTEEVNLIGVELNIKFTEDEFYEGDYFYDQFVAELIFENGETQILPIDVTPLVSHPMGELEGGGNTLSFGLNYPDFPYYTFEENIEVFAYYLDHVDFDTSEFNSEFYRMDDPDEVDFSKIKITGVYSDGDGHTIEKDIDISECSISDFDLATLGMNKTFTISYTTSKHKFSESFFYNVYEPMVTDLTLDPTGCSLYAYQGVAEGIIDLSALTYTLTYANGAKETYPYNVSGTNGSVSYSPLYFDNNTIAGTYPFEFSYNHTYWDGSDYVSQTIGPATINTEIRENKVESLMLDIGRVKNTFFVGDDYGPDFNWDNLRVYALTSAYEDFPELGKIELSSFEYDVSIDSFDIGYHDVVVTYNLNPEITATYQIQIAKDKPSSYIVSSYPGQVKQGSEIDLSNVELTVIYKSGRTEYYRAPDIEIGGNPSSAEIGTTSFTVIYQGEVVATKEIVVVEDADVLEGIHLSTNRISVIEGHVDDFNAALDAIIVYGEYRESGTVQLTKDKYTITGNVDINKVGEYKLTVTVKSGDDTFKQTIYVTVTERLKITDFYICNSVYFYVDDDVDFDTFLDDVSVGISFNIKDDLYTTMANEYLVFYNIGDFPIIDVPTKNGECLYGTVLVVLELDGIEYEFEVTYAYYVLERD